MSLEYTTREPDGILLVDKPAGITSHDVVWRVRKLFGTKKVGHTGTLDPMATGVLVVLLGRAAKACEYVSHDEKEYEATLRLGFTTDTEDVTGTILSQSDTLPTPAEMEAVLPSFRGEILQVPPMYSALKVNGRKLCDIARAGETVERAARPVTVKSLICEATDSACDYRMAVRVSGGTYIRTLCAEQCGNRVRRTLSPAHFYQCAHENPHHIMQKAIAGNGNLQFLALLHNDNAANKTDCGFLHFGIAAECRKIMLTQ
jgi:tRNA pseudouridine55 synthase